MRLSFYTWSSLIRHLRQPLSSWSFSIFSSNSWWEMCSSGIWARSVRPGGKYRSIRHPKILEIQTGIFGRMERTPGFYFYACMWSCSYSYGAPLGGPPELHYESQARRQIYINASKKNVHGKFCILTLESKYLETWNKSCNINEPEQYQRQESF